MTEVKNFVASANTAAADTYKPWKSLYPSVFLALLKSVAARLKANRTQLENGDVQSQSAAVAAASSVRGQKRARDEITKTQTLDANGKIFFLSCAWDINDLVRCLDSNAQPIHCVPQEQCIDQRIID